MNLWHKGIGWVKQNPDRAVPVSLVVIIALLIGGILLLNSWAGRSKVPTPFEIDNPEAPAVQVSTGKGKIEISRRMVAGMQEALYRQSFSAEGMEALLNGMPADQRRQILSSPTDFCASQLKGVDLKRTASDERRPLFSACLAVAQGQLPALRVKMLQDAVLLAALGAPSEKSVPSQLALKSAYQTLMGFTGASTRQQALARSGLSPEDVKLMARLGQARERFNQSLPPISEQRIRREFEAHPERYRNPARFKVTSYIFPGIDEASKGWNLLRQGNSDLKAAKLRFEKMPTRWIDSSSLPSADRKTLARAAPGYVLKPLMYDGVVAVLVLDSYQASSPAGFSEAKKMVRARLESERLKRSQRRLKKLLSRFSSNVYCEEVMAAADAKVDCGQSKPR